MKLEDASKLYDVLTSSMRNWRLQRERLEARQDTCNKENVPRRLKGGEQMTLLTGEISGEILSFLDNERAKTNRVDVWILLTKLCQLDPMVEACMHSRVGWTTVGAF